MPVQTDTLHDGALIEREPARRAPGFWAQTLAVVGVVCSAAYLVWRAGWTLGGVDWWLAVPVLLLEAHAAAAFLAFLFVTWRRERGDTIDADLLPRPPLRDAPGDIAVLITTTDESEGVLLPVVASATRVTFATSVHVLDLGDRAWVRRVADELGATYLVAPPHPLGRVAALNVAMRRSGADFVLILRGDQIAHPGLLVRAMHHFEDPHVAFVQLPREQSRPSAFEEADRPLFGLGPRRPRPLGERRLNDGVLQPGRARLDAVIAAGTNVIYRATAVRYLGGFPTDSATEEVLTSLRLHRRGWHAAYHDEVLARGITAGDARGYLAGRTREATGARQILRKEHPLTVDGLRFGQRLAYWSALTRRSAMWSTLAAMVLPPLAVLTGAVAGTPIERVVGAGLGVLALRTLARAALAGRFRLPAGRRAQFSLISLPAVIRSLGARVTDWRIAERMAALEQPRDPADRRRVRVPLVLGLPALLSLAALGLHVGDLLGSVSLPRHDLRWANVAAVVTAIDLLVLLTAIWRISARRATADRRRAVRFRPDAVDRHGAGFPIIDLSLTGALLTHPPDQRLASGDDLRLTVHAPAVTHVPIDLDAVVIDLREQGVAVVFDEGQTRRQAALANVLHSGFSGAVVERVDVRRLPPTRFGSDLLEPVGVLAAPAPARPMLPRRRERRRR